mmetsp:Transcript_878/g.1840  ORF Transcript_878/g.1840 Transcript_878/m.1840 type:complete len:234 (-) Transcript_878:3-704(-)
MNILPNAFITVSVIRALLFDPFHGVEGALANFVEIQCLTDAPQVCVVETSWTMPSPAMSCTDPDDVTTCETVFMGGYSWSWTIVENLVDGSDTDIDKAREEAMENGLFVYVIMEDDEVTCEISLDETCNMCSAEGCEEHPEGFVMVQYDCTNLENGRSSNGECVPLDNPFLYPILPKSEDETVLPDTNLEEPSTNLEDLFGGVSSGVEGPSPASRITLGEILFSITTLTVLFI